MASTAIDGTDLNVPRRCYNHFLFFLLFLFFSFSVVVVEASVSSLLCLEGPPNAAFPAPAHTAARTLRLHGGFPYTSFTLDLLLLLLLRFRRRCYYCPLVSRVWYW